MSEPKPPPSAPAPSPAPTRKDNCAMDGCDAGVWCSGKAHCEDYRAPAPPTPSRAGEVPREVRDALGSYAAAFRAVDSDSVVSINRFHLTEQALTAALLRWVAGARAETEAEMLAQALSEVLAVCFDAHTLVGLNANGEAADGPWSRCYDAMDDSFRRARALLSARSRRGGR